MGCKLASSLALLSILQFDPDFDAGTLPCELFIEGQSLHRRAYQLDDLISFGDLVDWDCSGDVLGRLMGQIVAKLSVEAVRIGVPEMLSPCFSVELGPHVGLMAIKI
jgi:hypothetical protein